MFSTCGAKFLTPCTQCSWRWSQFRIQFLIRAPVHWLLLGFWGNVCNSCFIACDDPVQKLIAVIMIPLQKCQCYALCFVFWCQLLCSVHSKLCYRLHFTVGRNWNKSLHLQLLQQCYLRSWEVLLVHVMQCLYSLSCTFNKVMQLMVYELWDKWGNLFCGRPLYFKSNPWC